ncbi:4a-hydroxytetrahydrobiopterin dehydratase [Aciduricibacillus chroicocephali]|uniref:4a-hydroxytetrahydrobiopterin dehydratase n=1 Tax=Aciduricibacillus chroicocephali TaxID=3054939 RepID=A0ABY9KVP6_9BACI|nr:4a-hydroxytetrahydrobiopterin dehydratase [Bacillaceae bacterium 44XB]
MKKQNAEDIASELKRLRDWKKTGGKIERTYEFPDFPKAIGFVNGISIYSESKDHHPIIEVNYNKVTLSLFTWCENALTKKDFETATYFDFLYGDSE